MDKSEGPVPSLRGWRIVGVASALALALSGCYARSYAGPPGGGAGSQTGEALQRAAEVARQVAQAPVAAAPTAPPPPRQETPTPRPSEHAVWKSGEWRYEGGRWVWWAGRWDSQPLATEWVKGQWQRQDRDSSWSYRPGYWLGGPREMLAFAALEWIASSPPPRPPPGYRQRRLPRPLDFVDHLWIDGYWGLSGGSWSWVDGHWARPPSPHCSWRPAVWVSRGNAWVASSPGWGC